MRSHQLVLSLGGLALVLAVVALLLRVARRSSGPGLALAAVFASTLPLLAGVGTVLLRRRHLELAGLTSVLETQWVRALNHVSAGHVTLARLVALPGMILGALVFVGSTQRGSRAGGWLLLAGTVLVWAGTWAFDLRPPPPARYALGDEEVWRLAIALEQHSCAQLTSAFRFGVPERALPPSLAGWQAMGEACVLDELGWLESQAELTGEWLRRRETLRSTPFLAGLDETLGVRVEALRPPESMWSPTGLGRADPSDVAIVQAMTARSRAQPEQCIEDPLHPLTIAVRVERDGVVSQLRQTGGPRKPGVALCLMSFLSGQIFLDVKHPTELELRFPERVNPAED
jgi:hypothetical protein